MSGFGGYNGGRTAHATPILLNVYDLSPANQPALNHIGCGIHHSGVEISGTEYSFAGGAGIFEDRPKEAGGAVFSHTVNLGNFEGSSGDVKAAISDLRDEFGADKYNILQRNCNHFADALSLRLLNTGIPGYVNRAANMGACFSCLLPEEMLSGAPVGPGDGTSATSAPSYSVMGGGNRAIGGDGGSTAQMRAFQTAGQSLGGSHTPASDGETDSLIGKREKARQAALARFDAKQA